MFNIIETPRIYILHANYYTTVMWHFTAKSHWRPYWELSCSGKYSAGPVCPCGLNTFNATFHNIVEDFSLIADPTVQGLSNLGRINLLSYA